MYQLTQTLVDERSLSSVDYLFQQPVGVGDEHGIVFLEEIELTPACMPEKLHHLGTGR